MDINPAKKAAGATSPELTDKVIFYFVDHGMQILTAICPDEHRGHCRALGRQSHPSLVHTDNSRVIVPNRKIVGEILHNYGNIRQLDLTVGIAYSADLTMALALVNEILQHNPSVLEEPAPVVGIAALNESSIALAFKPWVKVEDFVPAKAEIYQAVLESFRDRKIDIAAPRRDVHLLNPLS